MEIPERSANPEKPRRTQQKLKSRAIREPENATETLLPQGKTQGKIVNTLSKAGSMRNVSPTR